MVVLSGWGVVREEGWLVGGGAPIAHSSAALMVCWVTSPARDSNACTFSLEVLW